MIKKSYLFLTLLTAFLWLGVGNVWGAQSLPYSYGFEDYNLDTDGWTKYFGTSLSSNNSECAIVGAAKKTGSYGFRFSSYNTSGANAQYLISPELDAANGLDLTFQYKASSSYGTEVFKVGYSTTDADVANFTWVDDLSTNSTGWLQYEGSFPAGTKYVAVYYYSNYQYRLYVDDFEFVGKAAGPALQVLDGLTKISSGFNYNFGLATSGTLKMFTLNNPGTEAAPITVSHTGNFTVTPSTPVSIPAGEGTVLAVYMPDATGSDVITISSTAASIEDFVINVSGTIRDPNRVYETLLDGSKPTDWTTSGSWSWSTTNGASTTTYYESYNYRVITPLLTVAEGETFYFDAKGTYDGWQGVKFEYSADGTTWTASSTTTTVSSDWQTFMINDIPAGKYYIALHGWQVQLRNYYGGYIPAAPKDIVLTDKTTTSLTLNWTPAGSETSWVLQYSTDNVTWSDNIAVSAKPFELTGLNPSTKYYVRVSAAANIEWSAAADFRTECGAISSLPWNYGFEDDAASAAPACWQLITYYDDWDGIYYPYVAASNAYAGSKALAFSGGGSAATSPIAILPQFSNDISSLVLSFYYKATTGNSYAKLKVGYITNPADASTFVAIETLDQTSAYTQVGPFAFAAAPEGAYMAIQYAGGTSDYGAAYVDNITVEEAPSCMQPGKPAAAQADITANSAIVTWAAGGSESAWKLQYKAANGDWSDDIAVSAASYTLTNLSPVTTYYVRVKAVCGEQEVSEWSAEGDFTTDCGTMPMPFEENFSSSSAYPACWNASPNTGNYRWAPYSEYVSSTSSYNYEIRLRGSNASSELSTPSIELSEDAVLKFRWKNGSNTKITANVYISKDGGNTRALLPNDLSTKVTSWTNKTIDLSNYTGETVIIYFVSATGNSTSSYAYLDDVQVIAKPCEGPTGLAAAPTVDGGTISWIGSAKALRYKTGAAEWTKIAVSGTSHTLTGLQAETAYQVQVQAACAASDDEAWSASLAFTTKCAPSNVLPYENDFENVEAGELPACWDRISASAYPQVVSGAAAYGGSGKALYFYGNTDQKAVLPAFTQALKTLTISFYYKSNYSSHYEIGYLEADGVTFHTLASLPASTSFGSEPYELDLASISDDAAYLAILYTGATSQFATGYIDNVVVAKTPTCFKPASVTVESYTDNSAVINWTASGKGETQYQYVCVPSNATPDWDAATLTDQLTATVENLAAHKAYDFYVRSYCDTDDQSGFVSASFTTKCATAALPFDENFDAVADYDMPECWNVFAATYYAAYVANGQLQANAPKTDATVIVLPEMATTFVGASILFNYRTNNGTLKVGYVTDAEDKSTFVAVSEALTANTTTQVVVPFTAGSGNIALSFIGNTGDGDLYVDDIRIAHIEVFNDTENNESRLAELATAGETIDVIFNRTMLFNGDYNTLCLPFSLSAAQLAESPIANFKIKAFDYASVENQELLIAISPASSIQAGVPYFVANQDDEPNQTVQLYKDVVITASAPQSVDKGDVSFQGVINPVDLAAQNENDAHNQLFLAAGNTIYWPAQAKTVKGFRAYFNVTVNSGALKIKAGMPARIVERAEVPTGIEDVRGDVQSLKLIENGRVVILRNGVKYTIQGQVIQ